MRASEYGGFEEQFPLSNLDQVDDFNAFTGNIFEEATSEEMNQFGEKVFAPLEGQEKKRLLETRRSAAQAYIGE